MSRRLGSVLLGAAGAAAEQALEHRLLRAVLLGRRALGAFIGAERDLDLLGLAVAVHVERHLVARVLGAHVQHEVAGGCDVLAVELRDDVALLQAGFGRAGAFADGRHVGAFVNGQAVALGVLRVHGGEGHAELRMGRGLAVDDLLGEVHRVVYRDGEADAGVVAGVRRDQRVDADELAVRVDERAAGVTGVDSGVSLDHIRVDGGFARAVAVLIGVIGLGMTEAGKLEMLQGSASETIIVKIADLLSTYGIIPALLGGTILAGILASTMSTADSQLLAASSAVSSDLLGSILRKKADKKESMVADRVTLLLIAVIAVIIARNPDSSVFNIVSFAWAGFGAVFGPVVLFALFWRRTNWQGALAGMVSGGVMVFVWKYLVRPNVSFLNFYELLPAFLISSIMIILVSLATKAPSKEITDEFDLVQKKMAE